MPPESTPKYLKVLQEHLKNLSLESRKVHHVDIYHDSDCGMFQGRFCDCEPRIFSGPLVDSKYQEDSYE